MRFLHERVLNAPPLKLTPASLSTWVLFTDGACEGEERNVGSIGAVLFNPHGKCVLTFGALVPSQIMRFLGEQSLNPIYELEFMPVLVAFQLWSGLWTSSAVVCYLDNDAARSAFIRAYGATSHANTLISAFLEKELECQGKLWVGRVPTSSNIADAPSCLEFDQVELLGATKVDIPWLHVSRVLGVELRVDSPERG